MEIAWQCSIEDNDSYMLGEETQRVSDPELKQFYGWRFMRNGSLHPAICTRCGQKLDKEFVDPQFKLKKTVYDFSYTYDGYLIVSLSARDLLASLTKFPEEVRFVTLPAADGFYWMNLVNAPQLELNVEESGIRFEDHCAQCNTYSTVLLGLIPSSPPRPRPLVFRNVSTSIEFGIYRTDLEFACSHEKHPLLIFGLDTGATIQQQQSTGITLKKIVAP